MQISQYDNFDMSQEEREDYLIFAIFVAGKTADFSMSVTNKFLSLECGISPFDKIRKMIKKKELAANLRRAKTGNYGISEVCLTALVSSSFANDLKNATIEQLESIPKIGPKTARYFLMHSVRGIQAAALDTHILKWLNAQGYDAPKSTPSAGPKYRVLEKIFLKEAEKRNKTPAEFDLEIWLSYSKSKMPKYHESGVKI